ncbi:TPA: hypothetical protein ACPXRL_005309, partial [Klebsiella pneumoniae]
LTIQDLHMPNRCANRLTFSGIHHADELKTWVRGEQSPLPGLDYQQHCTLWRLNRGRAGDRPETEWKNA